MLWARAGAGYIHLWLVWAGHYLHTQGEGITVFCITVLMYLTLHSVQTKLIPLTALDLLCMNQPIYSLCRGKNLINLVIGFSFYVNTFFTHSKIVTNNFLEPSESLIYFPFKLLKSFKVFLKQNVNTFYLKD